MEPTSDKTRDAHDGGGWGGYPGPDEARDPAGLPSPRMSGSGDRFRSVDAPTLGDAYDGSGGYRAATGSYRAVDAGTGTYRAPVGTGGWPVVSESGTGGSGAGGWPAASRSGAGGSGTGGWPAVESGTGGWPGSPEPSSGSWPSGPEPSSGSWSSGAEPGTGGWPSGRASGTTGTGWPSNHAGGWPSDSASDGAGTGGRVGSSWDDDDDDRGYWSGGGGPGDERSGGPGRPGDEDPSGRPARGGPGNGRPARPRWHEPSTFADDEHHDEGPDGPAYRDGYAPDDDPAGDTGRATAGTGATQVLGAAGSATAATQVVATLDSPTGPTRAQSRAAAAAGPRRGGLLGSRKVQLMAVLGLLIGSAAMLTSAALSQTTGTEVPVLSNLAAAPIPPAERPIGQRPPPPATAGTCLSWQRSDAADATVVDCAGPHLFEQAGPVQLTQFGKDAPLPDDQSFRQVVSQQCVSVVNTYLGGRYDPDGAFRAGALKPSAKAWDDGDRTMRCGLQRFSRSGALYPISGKVGAQDQSDVRPAGTCLGIDGKYIGDPVNCSQPHAVQSVGAVDLSQKFKKFPQTGDQDSYLQPQCTKLAENYVGGEQALAGKNLSVMWDNLGQESWNAGSHKVACNLAAQLPDKSGFAPITGDAKGAVRVGDQPAPPAPRTAAPGAPAVGGSAPSDQPTGGGDVDSAAKPALPTPARPSELPHLPTLPNPLGGDGQHDNPLDGGQHDNPLGGQHQNPLGGDGQHPNPLGGNGNGPTNPLGGGL